MTVALRKQMIPPTAPMMMEYMGVVKPLAGVMTTRPATAPEIAPRTVGLPLLIHSMNIQPSAPVAAAKCVATNALDASPPAVSAEPALNPNHPTQSSAAPMTLNTTLCGGIGWRPKP